MRRYMAMRPHPAVPTTDRRSRAALVLFAALTLTAFVWLVASLAVAAL